MRFDLEFDPKLAPLAESEWLGQTVTDLEGQQGVVRRVYEVDAVQVAILTSAGTDLNAYPIRDEPLDLLARNGEKAAFAEYRQQVDEVGALEVRVLHGQSSEAETSRYRTLRGRLDPYSNAQTSLHLALMEQVQAGDRVIDYLKNWHGTVLDPDVPPKMPFRHTMAIRFDEAHRSERRPDGIVNLSTVTLYPTLGLL
ncbi:hypothetical protein [Streptomyces europaeiscabiei]|uniref:hypothetical protein n=1 Tax=Streptomyces europaeiscabiei TaxID=146819 RepID=UPI0038F65E80